jgi:hypothetical protein
MAKTENKPRMKLPMTLTANTLTGNPNMVCGEATIMYRRKAPTTAPTANSTNSIIFIFTYLISFGRHYQHPKRSGFDRAVKANAIARFSFSKTSQKLLYLLAFKSRFLGFRNLK